MGTANFHNKNASNIFAIEIQDSFELDLVKEDLWASLAKKEYTFIDKPDPDSLRSFPGSILAQKSERYYPTDGNEAYITIKAIVRSGYYSGINLDWEIETETILDPSNSEIIHRVRTWIEETKEILINELEEVYKQHSDSYQVSARFSNGNVIYTKA